MLTLQSGDIWEMVSSGDKQKNMNKPTLVLQAPIFSRSGYGDHSRDILKSIFDMNKYDVKVIPTNWGATPANQTMSDTEFGQKMIKSVITQLTEKPDIYINVSVANEFKPVGKYNIGITAGVETTLAPSTFITGCNLMDLIIVPSEFTKETLQKTEYQEVDKRTNKQTGILKITTPIEVIFEGVDLSIFNGKTKDTEILDNIPTSFNFLFVGHWLQGNLGQDRKDVGMMIKTFCTVFQKTQKKFQPGLILKTSSAGFSIGDRHRITKKIEEITKSFGENCPPVYLLFGDLKETELNELYNHPKVKSMLMFTKGEGYGRPLAEFATTGKPIIVSKWSGHLDFLPEEHTVYLDGDVKQVDKSAVNDFILSEGKWFTVNYSNAANKISDVDKNYKQHLISSKGLQSNIRENFSLEKMNQKFNEVFKKYVKVVEHKPFIPIMKKI